MFRLETSISRPAEKRRLISPESRWKIQITACSFVEKNRLNYNRAYVCSKWARKCLTTNAWHLKNLIPWRNRTMGRLRDNCKRKFADSCFTFSFGVLRWKIHFKEHLFSHLCNYYSQPARLTFLSGLYLGQRSFGSCNVFVISTKK